MISFDVKADAAGVLKNLDALIRDQLPQATAWALNDTAYDGFRALQAEMVKVFDRPTAWTLNAFMVWRADKRTLTATVRERPSVGSRHYLKVQGKGGVRPSTGLESLLRSRVATGTDIVTATPGRGAKLDAFGNWSRGEMNQALSGIKAQRDATANTTAASKKRSRARGRAAYFVPKPGSKLSPGIYRRDGAKGAPVKVLNFSSRGASYGQRIDYLAVVQAKASQVYAHNFDVALAKALATAR